MSDAISPVPGGVRLRVRLTPRSARDAVEAQDLLSDGSSVVVVRVRAVPEKGAANAALLAVLAEAAAVPRSRVTLVSGATARIKTVDITGDPAALIARLSGTQRP